jgi:hypothetical protein
LDQGDAVLGDEPHVGPAPVGESCFASSSNGFEALAPWREVEQRRDLGRWFGSSVDLFAPCAMLID